MRPGFWQVVIVGGLLVIFFAPQLIKIVRALTGGDGSRDEARSSRGGGRDEARPSRGGGRCHKCGAKLPPDSRFCPKCGCNQDVIDV